MREEEEKKMETAGDQEGMAGSEEETRGVDVDAVEGILGYRFRDRALVAEALTHVSLCQYHQQQQRAGEPGEEEEEEEGEEAGLARPATYERLEFMGDAVLNCVVAREMFGCYRELPPGPLTRLRAANVDTEKLARVAVETGLYRFLRHRAPYLDGQIQEFMEAMLDYPIHSNGLLDSPKVLADIVEALLGAVFVDSNSDLDAVWKVFKQLSRPLIRPETLRMHPMSELHELCQKKGMALSFLKDAWTESMAVEVLVDGKLVGRATYGHKKEVALYRAAKAALDHLKLVLAGGEDASPPGLSESLQQLDLGSQQSDEDCTAAVRSNSQEKLQSHAI